MMNSPLLKVWSLAGHTLVEWQSSTMSIGDLKLDLADLFGLNTIANGLLVAEIAIGSQLFDFIVQYLEDKPLGQQSIMDVFHKTMLRSVKSMSIVVTPYMILRRSCLDSGDWLSKILMWPVFDCITVSTLTIGINPIVQLILALNEGLEMPFSDKWLYRILMAAMWIPMILSNLVCSYFGYLPPVYYMLRQREVEYHAFGYIRLAIFLLSLLAYTAGWFLVGRISKKHKEPKKHLLNSKVNMFGGLVFLLFMLAITFQMERYTSEIIALAIVIILPMMLILTNENLRMKAERQQTGFIPIMMNRWKSVCRKICKPTPQDQMEMGNITH